MKSVLKLILVTAIATSFSSHLSASNFPGFCENTKFYKDNAPVIQVPASVGGCVSNVAGIAIGGTVGLFFGKPKESAYFTGLIFNAVGNAVVGAPTKIVKSIFWDLPKDASKRD